MIVIAWTSSLSICTTRFTANASLHHCSVRHSTYTQPLLQIDVDVTEAANEAKDNVKFLYTLERFIEPLYSGTATTIIDTLPALMNSIKMIHTIAR